MQQNTKPAERHVAIIGTALIGRAWAAIFARAGWQVRLTDPHQPTLDAAPVHDRGLATAPIHHMLPGNEPGLGTGNQRPWRRKASRGISRERTLP
jgi:hypothetical protein